jgi:hypothetical protein
MENYFCVCYLYNRAGLFYIYHFCKEVTTVYPAPDNGAWSGVVSMQYEEAMDKNKDITAWRQHARAHH